MHHIVLMKESKKRRIRRNLKIDFMVTKNHIRSPVQNSGNFPPFFSNDFLSVFSSPPVFPHFTHKTVNSSSMFNILFVR